MRALPHCRAPAECQWHRLLCDSPTRELEVGVPRWRYDAQPLLRYATVAEAPLYREIMEVFAQAATGYASRLSPEDVHAALLARLDSAPGRPTGTCWASPR